MTPNLKHIEHLWKDMKNTVWRRCHLRLDQFAQSNWGQLQEGAEAFLKTTEITFAGTVCATKTVKFYLSFVEIFDMSCELNIKIKNIFLSFCCYSIEFERHLSFLFSSTHLSGPVFNSSTVSCCLHFILTQWRFNTSDRCNYNSF